MPDSVISPSQRAPAKLKPAKVEGISSGRGRRECSCKRFEYQVVASVHNWFIVTSGPQFICPSHSDSANCNAISKLAAHPKAL